MESSAGIARGLNPTPVSDASANGRSADLARIAVGFVAVHGARLPGMKSQNFGGMKVTRCCGKKDHQERIHWYTERRQVLLGFLEAKFAMYKTLERESPHDCTPVTCKILSYLGGDAGNLKATSLSNLSIGCPSSPQ